MKILIATDGSTASDTVIQEVLSRPWPKDSEFALVTAVDPFFFVRAPLLLEEAKNNTSQSLEDDAQTLQAGGWKASTHLVMENPRHGIARLAAEWKADLIVMGSHGRGAFTRLMIGSTAQAVLRHATCSVEIVRARSGEKPEAVRHGMRVLIPTDGSEHAEYAAQFAAQRPWPEETEFKVLACPEFPVLVGEYPFYPTEQIHEMAQTGERQARLAAEAATAQLAKSGRRAVAEVTEFREAVARTILSSAELWQADLIVMGSHGRRGFDRLILGSVSETVAMHAHCSVEVVRKPPAS